MIVGFCPQNPVVLTHCPGNCWIVRVLLAQSLSLILLPHFWLGLESEEWMKQSEGQGMFVVKEWRSNIKLFCGFISHVPFCDAGENIYIRFFYQISSCALFITCNLYHRNAVFYNCKNHLKLFWSPWYFEDIQYWKKVFMVVVLLLGVITSTTTATTTTIIMTIIIIILKGHEEIHIGV